MKSFCKHGVEERDGFGIFSGGKIYCDAQRIIEFADDDVRI